MISLYGATGFLGSNLVKLFPDEYYIQGRDELSPKFPHILFLISTVHNYNVFTDTQIDIQTNAQLPIRVLELAYKKFGAEVTFDFVSSWFVYGNSHLLRAKEDSHCDPAGFYSITKLAGERLVASYCATFGLSYRIYRMASLIGNDQRATIKKNAISYFLQEIARGNSISIYETSSYRDLIDVRDASDAINFLGKYGDKNEVYNVGCGQSYDVKHVLTTAANNRGIKVDYTKVPNFHKVVQGEIFSMNVDKLLKTGWKPKYSIEETIEWMMNSVI